jgi:hypothetical protein
MVLSSSLMSSAKTAVYPNLTPNSPILERGKGNNIYVFQKKKRRAKNLALGMARPGHGSGAEGSGLILQMEPWLGFRRGASGQCAAMNK